MSDNMRQSFTDKAGNALKPENEKSTTERMGDTVKGKADSAASSAQPEGEKSYMQQASDSLSGNQNENSDSLLGKAKGAMGMGGGNQK
ncbi:hypothetical protein M0805_003593 [Coniferiporia weirii]|nr:hypothetical protein M0805_003593 [Coniferiporia weirii]